MPAVLTSDELEIVNQLLNHGLSRSQATVAVAMVTREHMRPQTELIDILRQYQGLEIREDIVSAITDLRQKGWLEEYESYGLTLLRQSSDLRAKIAEVIGKKSLKQTLARLRCIHDPVVSVVGSMTDEKAYSTYLDRLRRAQTDMCIPMLATTPALEAAAVIKERARNGVKVRILLASTDVVCKLRGNTMRSVSLESLKGWAEHARAHSNIQLRVTSQQSDMRMASCALIDGRILRLDIYVHTTQRSLQGTMIEATTHNPHQLNIISMFQDMFDEAWDRAQPMSCLARLCHQLKANGYWLLFAAFLSAAWLTADKPVIAGMFSSSAATLLVTGLVQSWPRIRSSVKDLLKNG